MANLTDLKKINRARILEELHTAGACSRAAIADRLGLDRKSLTNLASELLADGLLREVGIKYPKHGRPMIMLDLDQKEHWLMGLQLLENQVIGVIVTLRGDIKQKVIRTFSFDGTIDEIRQAICSAYQELKQYAGHRLKATGLAVPGIIEMTTGKVLRSVNIAALSNIELKSLLPDDAVEPFCYEESSRAKALAELWFGQGRNQENFVSIDLGIGIGAGIVLQHQLQSRTYIGEIGHVVIAPGGKLCRCGHRGCLEAYLSERIILGELNRELNADWKSLAEIPENLSPVGEQLLKEAGHMLGLGLAAIINILCPPLVILNGNLMRYQEIILPAIERGLEEAALPSCRKHTAVVSSPFGVEAGALGAAALAASLIFQ